MKLLQQEMVTHQSGWAHWDKSDRVFGIFMTSNGVLRRVDIIVVAFLEWPFTLLSWTGSKVRVRARVFVCARLRVCHV